jgi:hypothetical protein
MPAKGARVPESRRTRVLDWYRTHPGFHRCQDVAKALGEPTHGVAVDSRNLMVQGDIARTWSPPSRLGGKPIVLYGVPAAEETK